MISQKDFAGNPGSSGLSCWISETLKIGDASTLRSLDGPYYVRSPDPGLTAQ